MSILVTGAAGFIGSYLTQELIESGHAVVGVSRSMKPQTLERLHALSADITRTDQLEGLPDGVRAVMHLAAHLPRDHLDPRSALRCLTVNAKGTLNLLEWARRHEVRRFIYASSQAVYGRPRYLPVDEEHPTYPSGRIGLYGASKLMGEIFCQRYTELGWIDGTSLRLGFVYGAGMHEESYLFKWVQSAAHGDNLEMPAIETYSNDFVYVKDVVQACNRAYLSGRQGVYNIGSGREVSLEDLASIVLSLFPDKPSQVIGRLIEPDSGYRFWLSISKAERKLGYQARYPLREGLAGMISHNSMSQESPG